MKTNILNNTITSQNLDILEVLELYNLKYNLTESDITKYITAYDNITNYLGCNKYKLTEGITNNKNKYNNILIDLYHQTIPSEIIDIYPIGIVFNLKLDKNNSIQDLTKTDLNKYKNKYFLFVQEKLKFQIKFPSSIGKLKFKLIKINYLKVQKLCRYSYMFVKINKIWKLK